MQVAYQSEVTIITHTPVPIGPSQDFEVEVLRLMGILRSPNGPSWCAEPCVISLTGPLVEMKRPIGFAQDCCILHSRKAIL